MYFLGFFNKKTIFVTSSNAGKTLWTSQKLKCFLLCPGIIEPSLFRIKKCVSHLLPQKKKGVNFHWICGVKCLNSLNNRTDVGRYLLKKGANVDKQNGEGQTALHWASFMNYTDVIRILLQHGARTDIKNIIGSTPIDRARGLQMPCLKPIIF